MKMASQVSLLGLVADDVRKGVLGKFTWKIASHCPPGRGKTRYGSSAPPHLPSGPESLSRSRKRPMMLVAGAVVRHGFRHLAALAQAAKGKAAASVGSIAIGGMVCSSLTIAGVLYPCRATSQVSL